MTDVQIRLAIVIVPLVSIFAMAIYIALNSKPPGNLDNHLVDYLDVEGKVPKRDAEDED